MKIFLPPKKDCLINSSLTDEEFFRKNVIYLDKIRSLVFIQGMTEEIQEVLNELLKYFEQIEEYKYCTDIQKIFEMNEELFGENL